MQRFKCGNERHQTEDPEQFSAEHGKSHCLQFALSYKNRVLGSYGHGGARSVILVGGPPRLTGTYILGNSIIRGRWNDTGTCFKKVHQKILHKYGIFCDFRYEI